MQYHQQTGRENFVCGAELEDRGRKSEIVMDSVQNPVDPCFGVYLAGQETITLTCITRPTKKSESQRVILVGRSNWNILYLSPLC